MSTVKAPDNKVEKLRDSLIKVARDRDIQAFEALFDHYAPLIRAYSLAREPGAELVADELAQDVMVRVWEKAHTYKPELSNPNTWVFVMARNCRIDYLRRNGRIASNVDPALIFEQLEDDAAGPFQSAMQERLGTNIHECIARLPKEQAQVLLKVYMEGKTQQEASVDLKLPLGTVKSRVRLALKKLQVLVAR